MQVYLFICIVAAMARRTLELEIVELTHAVGLLMRRIRAAAAMHGLSLSEGSVLARLSNDGAATIAELARAESVRPQSMGATIAALEERELVERKPHPTDGRQINIAITSRGAALRASIRSAKHSWLAQAVTQLDKREQETLFAAAEIIKRLAEQ